MLASVAASAAAARELGYPGLAHLIEADGLGAQQIASLQRLSCCKTAARDYAVIILAGSIGRYRATPDGWSGEHERELALKVLVGEPDPQATLWQLSEKAGRIIPEGWKAEAERDLRQ
jgi:hypothetical protein